MAGGAEAGGTEEGVEEAEAEAEEVTEDEDEEGEAAAEVAVGEGKSSLRLLLCHRCVPITEVFEHYAFAVS